MIDRTIDTLGPAAEFFSSRFPTAQSAHGFPWDFAFQPFSLAFSSDRKTIGAPFTQFADRIRGKDANQIFVQLRVSSRRRGQTII